MMPAPATPILTSSAMRAAEEAAVAGGTSLGELMERAGTALGRLALSLSGGRPIHIMCGSGNNGGDGYVAARWLAGQGVAVRLSRTGPPACEPAASAAALWSGSAGVLSDAATNGCLLVDCLFGIGLNRPLEDGLVANLARHAGAAWRVLAADVPSGVDADGATSLGCPYRADVTLAFGVLKPAHVLQPAAQMAGRVLCDPLGIQARSDWHMARLCDLPPPGPDSHKYARGMVAVVAGNMAGAAMLSARGALSAGAGYVLLAGSSLPPGPPHAIVRRGWNDGAVLDDDRIGSVVIGPGLSSGEMAAERWARALGTGKPLVVDAGALALAATGGLPADSVLTPHAGEFARLPGAEAAGNKIERTLSVAAATGAVVVHKGSDTVIAAPDGRVAVHSPGCAWLSTAGTGDVLAGITAAMLARGIPAFEAAQAGVILLDRAARHAGPAFCADDLVAAPVLA